MQKLSVHIRYAAQVHYHGGLGTYEIHVKLNAAPYGKLLSWQAAVPLAFGNALEGMHPKSQFRHFTSLRGLPD